MKQREVFWTIATDEDYHACSWPSRVATLCAPVALRSVIEIGHSGLSMQYHHRRCHFSITAGRPPGNGNPPEDLKLILSHTTTNTMTIVRSWSCDHAILANQICLPRRSEGPSKDVLPNAMIQAGRTKEQSSSEFGIRSTTTITRYSHGR